MLQLEVTCCEGLNDSFRLSNKLHEFSIQLINVFLLLFLFPPNPAALTPPLPHLSPQPLICFLCDSRAPLLSISTSKQLTKAGQCFFAFQRYKLGADSALFSQDYTDPSQDAAGAPYTSFGGDDLESPSGGGGGQTNSDGAFDGTGGYQRQDY